MSVVVAAPYAYSYAPAAPPAPRAPVPPVPQVPSAQHPRGGNTLLYLLALFVVGLGAGLFALGYSAVSDLQYTSKHPTAHDAPFLIRAFDPTAGSSADSTTAGLTYKAAFDFADTVQAQPVVGKARLARFTDFTSVVPGYGLVPNTSGWMAGGTSTQGFVGSKTDRPFAAGGGASVRYPAWFVLEAPSEIGARQICYNTDMGIDGIWPLSSSAASTMRAPVHA